MSPTSTVGIVGLGLMGGSLARALHALEDRPSILAWSRERADLDAALRAGVIDYVVDDADVVAASAELVVYATPLRATIQLIEQHRGRWAPDAVVTDVASLKGPIIERVRELGVETRFVGGHPLAGGERSGFGSAEADLYVNARVWLMSETGDEASRDRVAQLWTRVGARPSWTSAAVHDERMVWASHLPQLVSNAISLVLERRGLSRRDLGPGGRDMTRLAGSSPDIWMDLLESSGPADARTLEELARELSELAGHLDEGRHHDLERLMHRTRRWIAADEDGSDGSAGPQGSPEDSP